jgi:pimeloyl-ACP methyl ester carboxylesterase
MKVFGMDARSYLIKGALRRKKNWESAEEAFRYFRGRNLFRNWTDEAVRIYTQGMTAPSPEGGVSLIYPPEWEAQIYRTIPTDVWAFAAKVQKPLLVIRGENSNTFTRDSEKSFRKVNPRALFEVVGGAGHLVAQEKPEEVGKLISDFLKNRSL